ncbi:hypothetical protein IWX50DRAFT_2001 [Phyllosticta citricarpa]
MDSWCPNGTYLHVGSSRHPRRARRFRSRWWGPRAVATGLLNQPKGPAYLHVDIRPWPSGCSYTGTYIHTYIQCQHLSPVALGRELCPTTTWSEGCCSFLVQCCTTLDGNSPKPWMVKRNTMPQATLFPNISPHNLRCCSTHLPSLLLMTRPRPSKKGRYIHRAAETVDTSGADDAPKLWRCTDYCAPTNPFSICIAAWGWRREADRRMTIDSFFF